MDAARLAVRATELSAAAGQPAIAPAMARAWRVEVTPARAREDLVASDWISSDPHRLMTTELSPHLPLFEILGIDFLELLTLPIGCIQNPRSGDLTPKLLIVEGLGRVGSSTRLRPVRRKKIHRVCHFIYIFCPFLYGAAQGQASIPEF